MIPIRKLLLALPIIALFSAAAMAAEDFPLRPVRALMPAAAGTGSDLLGRAFAEEATKRLKQNMVIENRPGGGGIIATRALQAAPPDGYTLLMHGPAMVTNMLTDPAAGYRMDDFVAVAPIGQISFTLGITSSLPAKNLTEFVTYLKANPGKANFGSIGPTSLNAMATARFLFLTGTKAQAVEYKDAPVALLDVASGRIQMFLQTTPLLQPQVTSGNVRAVAVTSDRRSPQLPDVPTFRELGMPEMYTTVWLILFTQKSTPPAVVERLRQELSGIQASPEFGARLKAGGFDPLTQTGRELEDYVRQEVTRWEADIKRTRGGG